MSIIFQHHETLKRLGTNDIGMTDEDISSQRKAKAEERKEEVIKAQTPGPKTAEALGKRQVRKRLITQTQKPTRAHGYIYPPVITMMHYKMSE